MADSLFDYASAALEQRTFFDRVEARGTLRLALKDAGLDARSVSVGQLRVVLAEVMPKELASRGVDAPQQACESVSASLAGFSGPDTAGDSPEALFERLGKS